MPEQLNEPWWVDVIKAFPVVNLVLGAFAYLTDCNRIPDESWSLLEGLDVLVLDALRHRPHPTHFSVVQSLTAIACLGCLYTFGVESCLHVATASATFVYCSLGEWALAPCEEC